MMGNILGTPFGVAQAIGERLNIQGCPVSVDPQGWLVTLPLLAALLWLYFQPAEHAIKRVWRDVMRQEAQAMAQVAGVDIHPDSPLRLRIERMLYWAAIAVLALGTLASVAAYLGLMPAV